jgi:Tetrapyrrole (Corrin/Porphyrin) Methylases
VADGTGQGRVLTQASGERRKGSLTVVGTGIQLGLHATPQTRAVLARADEVLYMVTDPLAGLWIEGLNPNARSLGRFYDPGKDRVETYAEMVEEILAAVRSGREVTAAFYGHPGVFVDPGHEAVKRARVEGFRARMLPAISAEDCLFADLGLDPGETGCQSYEATAFLIYRHRVEPSALLVLWQIAFLGDRTTPVAPPRPPLELLVERLREVYPAAHETIVYEASPYAVCDASVQRLPLADLAGAEVAPMATLVVPPSAKREPDVTMRARLGLPRP